jgi:hypothetical protein
LTRSALFALAVVLAPISAYAEDDPVKRADQLFKDGQRLLKQGKLAEACASFADSQKLDPALGTLLNLADCHAQERRFATARAEFDQAAREAAQAGQKEREAFAKEQWKQLEALLSYVVVKFDGPVGGLVIDGKEVDASRPIAIDPGPHEFRFAAPGRLSKTIRFEVANGPSSQTLEAPQLDPEPQIRPNPEQPPPVKPKREDPKRLAAYAAAGAGGVAFLVGTYFGLHAASKKSDAEPHCNGHFCDADGLALQDDAHSAATVSTIAFGVSILALGAAAYLYFTSDRSSHVAVRVAPGVNAARLEARW